MGFSIVSDINLLFGCATPILLQVNTTTLWKQSNGRPTTSSNATSPPTSSTAKSETMGATERSGEGRKTLARQDLRTKSTPHTLVSACCADLYLDKVTYSHSFQVPTSRPRSPQPWPSPQLFLGKPTRRIRNCV